MKIEFLFAALNLNLLSVKKITRKNARFMDGVYFIIIWIMQDVIIHCF